MLLSVVIPTRNRARFLGNMLHSLEGVLSPLLGDYEIVVSNNHSSDTTLAVIKEAATRIPDIHAYQPPHPLDTAEENLRFSIGKATGDYVWLLGDDDIPDLTVFLTLIPLLKSYSYDFILYNSKGIDNEGREFSPQKVPCTNSIWETTLRHFIVNDGFTYTLAGFSTIVFRRSELDLSSFDKHMDLCKIYSHVMTFIHCFSDKRFIFVNLPLVKYRRNQYAEKDTGHWERYATSQSRFKRYFWTVGLVDHFNALVESGKLSYQDLFFTIEQADNCRYRLLYWMIDNICQQLRFEQSRNEQFGISREEMSKLAEFFKKVMPGEWFLLERLNDLLSWTLDATATREQVKKAWAEKLDLVRQIEVFIQQISTEPVLLQFFISSINDRKLFYHDGRFFFTKEVRDFRSSALNRVDYQATDFVEFVEVDALLKRLPYIRDEVRYSQYGPEILENIRLCNHPPNNANNEYFAFAKWLDRKLFRIVRSVKRMKKTIKEKCQ